jgi:hypothetical protein
MMSRRWFACVAVALFVIARSPSQAQADLYPAFDKILDTYVRDGFVYYRALQKERAALDRYVASLDIPRARIEGWSRTDQEAFWVNAYNALVLRTVIDAYPMRVHTSQFPPKSIRQIPGAFDQVKHRVGGRALTLDEIEKTVIVPFGDARLVLALGRGALGSGRLHSESYRGATLETELKDVTEECATHVTCVKVNPDRNLVEVTPVVSWREDVFIQTFAPPAEKRWASRAPIERAVAAMVYSHLFQSEREFLDAGTFKMQYGEFDWRLNDLTGGVPE